MPIITSLLDTDLYKFTMQQCILHRFPSVNAEFKFVCRTPDTNLGDYYAKIFKEITHLCSLKFQNDELEYLRSLRFISDDYVEFLRGFKLNSSFVQFEPDENNDLILRFKGPWLHVTMFEVYVMAIISEIYCKNQVAKTPISWKNAWDTLSAKSEKLKNTNLPINVSDFGTRRRYSKAWQENVVAYMSYSFEDSNVNFSTSNVFLAKKYDLMPVGTMAHEYLQAAQALVRLQDSQKFALENWVQEYRGDLGIALTDVINMDSFVKDFDLYFAKLFDGCRHDSGDPIEWGNKLIKAYKDLNIDPMSKKAIFSDGLNFDKIMELNDYFGDKIQTAFGIGTNLTNDVGIKPLSIVIKMVTCNDQPVAKISDTPGKTICEDLNYYNYLKSVFT